MNMNKGVTVSISVGVVAIAIAITAFTLTIVERIRIENAISTREPKAESLESFTQPTAKAFWVAVPITNSSTSPSGVAHRVRVTVTFSPDNPIKEIKADPFVVVGGGKGNHSTTLELSVLYPQSVIYLSFLVDRGEIPQVDIDWAEKR